MATQNSKNFVDSVLEAQKKLVDSAIETTKKVANGNTFVTETIDKGSEFYKNWLNEQQKNFTGANEKVEQATETAKENMGKMNEFYQTWLNNQINWYKQAWELNQNWIKNAASGATDTNKFTNPSEFFNGFNTAMNNWSNFVSQAATANQWWNFMQQYSPANASDTFKKATTDMNNMFNNFYELMNTSFAQLQKNMQNATTQDAYANMINTAAGFGKFYEIWAPFWKSIQEKTFHVDQFKQMFNADAYKEMTDKFFGFVPDASRQYFQQMSNHFNDGFKHFAGAGRTGFNNMKDFFAGMNPMANLNVFETSMNAYQQMQQAFQHAVSPIAKMVTPNQYTKNAAEWSDIADRMAIFNIKNAEMQYMMYQQGTKVMERLAENVASKIENGVEINSITALYQEWLNLSDKVYVELFDSEAYSKLMAEVSALQLKLRKDIELQYEKMLAGVPVATRSEMDELYKVIYDLKKEVRQLEKMLEIDGNVVNAGSADETSGKATRKTSTKK
jgi:hypothetical protein